MTLISVEYEKLYAPHQRNSEFEDLTDTLEPTIHYDLLQNEFGTFAYLRLDSFDPEELSEEAAVILIKGLLENELAGTDGLILDLRDNGGGWIFYGESLVQLFTAKNVKTHGFRLQNTKVVRDLFAAIPDWSQPYRDTLHVADTIGAKYTVALPLTSPEQANKLGQSYFKPIAVLTNSSCYSTCDMMASLMQDLSVATIWGEDGRTGAGGANNVDLSYYIDNLPTGHSQPFYKLPGNQSMGVSWRQTVRIEKHAGVLLEEAGVSADRLATPAVADFFTDSLFQIRTISSDLSHNSGGMQSWYKKKVERVDIGENTTPEITLQVADTEAVEYRINGNTLGLDAVEAPASTSGTELMLKPDIEGAIGTMGSLELIGYKSGERVWRAMQDYRFIPEYTHLANDDQVALDFSVPDITPLIAYSNGAPSTEGWSVQNGKLKTGLGDTYKDNLDIEASMFIDLTDRINPVILSFDIEGKTEKDYDFFSVNIYSENSNKEVFPSTSGDIPQQKIVSDLSEFLGKKIEIRFRFVSDGRKNDRGISIGNLIVGM